MKTLFLIVKGFWLNFKIYIRVHFFYPFQYGYKKISSILPGEFLLGKNNFVGKEVVISQYLKFTGKYVYIGDRVHIESCSGIGNYTCISNNVRIGAMNHALDHVSINPLFYKKEKGWVKKTTFD